MYFYPYRCNININLTILDGLKIYFLNKYFDPSAAIDIKNIQYIGVSLPFFEEKLAYPKGCVVKGNYTLMYMIISMYIKL